MARNLCPDEAEESNNKTKQNMATVGSKNDVR